MNKISPQTPSYVFGYWRPWKENSNMFDSWLDYTKDVSLTKYGADAIGRYLQDSSKEQVQAINNVGKIIGMGINILSKQLSVISNQLNFINQNLTLVVEQQQLTNYLLADIQKLLKVPDSEKERQLFIERGIKFFMNAQKDSYFFEDALTNFLMAEELMNQDYFVLHKIGMIYLFSTKHINPTKAYAYFSKAAKYASIESDPSQALFVNTLLIDSNVENANLNGNKDQIKLLASISFEKAALAAYITGDYNSAETMQQQALEYNVSAENYFLLSKYQSRIGKLLEGAKSFKEAIYISPILANAAFTDLDILSNQEILNLLVTENSIVDQNINNLIEQIKPIKSKYTNYKIEFLTESLKQTFDIKILAIQLVEEWIKEINELSKKAISEAGRIEKEIKRHNWVSKSNQNELIISYSKISFFLIEEISILNDKAKILLEKDVSEINEKVLEENRRHSETSYKQMKSELDKLVHKKDFIRNLMYSFIVVSIICLFSTIYMLNKYEKIKNGLFYSEIEYKNTITHLENTLNLFGRIPLVCSIITVIIIGVYISILKVEIKESELKLNSSDFTFLNVNPTKDEFKILELNNEKKLEKIQNINDFFHIFIVLNLVCLFIDFVYEAYFGDQSFYLMKIFGFLIVISLIFWFIFSRWADKFSD